MYRAVLNVRMERHGSYKPGQRLFDGCHSKNIAGFGIVMHQINTKTCRYCKAISKGC